MVSTLPTVAAVSRFAQALRRTGVRFRTDVYTGGLARRDTAPMDRWLPYIAGAVVTVALLTAAFVLGPEGTYTDPAIRFVVTMGSFLGGLLAMWTVRWRQRRHAA